MRSTLYRTHRFVSNWEVDDVAGRYGGRPSERAGERDLIEDAAEIVVPETPRRRETSPPIRDAGLSALFGPDGRVRRGDES